MYSKAKGLSFTSQVGFNFLPSITTKQSAKLYSQLELTKHILRNASYLTNPFALVLKYSKWKTKTNKQKTG